MLTLSLLFLEAPLSPEVRLRPCPFLPRKTISRHTDHHPSLTFFPHTSFLGETRSKVFDFPVPLIPELPSFFFFRTNPTPARENLDRGLRGVVNFVSGI